MFEELELLDKEIKALEQTKGELIHNLIEDSHPLSIGDEATVNYKWSHIGKKMEIDSLGVSNQGYSKGYIFTASGYVKKKNGDTGMHRGHWCLIESVKQL